MKKLLLIFIAAGIIMTGCAKKDTIKPEEQSATGKTIAGQGQTDDKQSGKQTTVPVEKVTSLDASDKDQAVSDSALKALQAKVQDIYFDFDKYDIRNSDIPILKEVSNLLIQNKNIRVIIEGHCDERGTNEYNLALGDRRANSVRKYLMSLAVPSAKMDAISYGEEKPICRQSTEECWAKNRRAHFALSRGGK